MLNIYLKAIESFNFYKDFSIVLPIKKSLSKYIEQLIIGKNINFKITILDDEEAKYESFVVADYAIATSGTVALELSYFNIAYLVAYKFNFLSYVIIKMLAQAKFANLINIINDKKVIPELIQSECSINNIGQTLEKIINDNKYKNNILNASANAIKQLRSTAAPSDLAADEVIRLIKND